MARPSVSLVVAAAALVALVAPAMSHAVMPVDDTTSVSKNPLFNPQYCPNTISRQAINPRLASDCKGIIIPWRLCTKCRLRKFDAKGMFEDNRDIYDLSQKPCLDGLKFYVEQNPCDTPRVNQVKEYTAALAENRADRWPGLRAQKDLAEFMYNVCELCCDCVPIGAQLGEYDERKAVKKWVGNASTLIHVYRGNCPVHYYYDTCRMWPDLRDIASPGNTPDTSLDRICQDHVYPWWFNPNNYRENWLRRPVVQIPSWRFVSFLAKMTWLLGCSDRTLWNECVSMEAAQGRV